MKTTHLQSGRTSSAPLVFIHGLFMNPESWGEWKAYFEAQGYTCYAPAYPFHAGDPKMLRAKIHPGLGLLTFEEVVRTLAAFIDTLPEKPILIGHSLGGLIVQKLISMDKAVAGVCIDGAAPVGIIPLEWSFWKSNFPVINYLQGDSPFEPTPEWFHYTFGNTLSRAESDQVFEAFAIPESRNIARGTLKPFAKIDFRKPHQPLLFIAGEKDHIIPASLNRKNVKAYKDPNSLRTFREFPGRGHYICGEPGWEEVADYVAGWLKQLA